MRKLQIYAIGVVTVFFWGFKKNLTNQPKTTTKPPNIVLILADDLGFSDIGCYGSEINTPHLDQLAKEGVRLRQCYNNGICAPSRATLLTGQYPHKAGVGFFNQNLGTAPYQGFLNKESLTFAEVFKEAGYQTYLSGKWHVGNDSTFWPHKRGFDKFFGFITGAFSYLDVKAVTKGSNNFLVNGTTPYSPPNKDFYLTDELTERSISFIENGKKNTPFLLYLAYSAPHWPLHAKPSDIAKYKGKYTIGWDSLRTLRHQRQLKLGITTTNQAPHKDTSLPAWSTMSYDERNYWTKKMEVYAAQVDNLDQNIGKLIQYLKRTNQLDNTLIVFVSDNGAESWDFSKLSIAIPRNTGPVGTGGSNESYTKNWAQASAMPLRSYKSTPYEGGISTPFIARLPQVIPANSLTDGLVHFVDFMPTFLELTHTNYPKTYKNTATNTLTGTSFAALLKGQSWQRTQPVFYEWAGHRMVRKGKWKIVSVYPQNQWELYDMEIDRNETKNIVAQNPQIIKELSDEYTTWAKQNNVSLWNETMQNKTNFPTK